MHRKAELEEEARQYQLRLEREQRERQRKFEQTRINRLLDEVALLRQAIDIRTYVEAVRARVANESGVTPVDAVHRWSHWALAEADRIDPVHNGRFLHADEEGDREN